MKKMRKRRTLKEATSLFDECRGTLEERAYRVAQITNRAHMADELYSEAVYGFMEAYRRWVDGGRRSKFNTYLYRATTNALLNFVRKTESAISYPTEIELFGPEPPRFALPVDVEALRATMLSSSTEMRPDKRLVFKESLEGLSQEALRTTDILLGTPDAVLELVGGETPRTIRRLLRERLRSEGFSRDRSYAAFSELRSLVKAF